MTRPPSPLLLLILLAACYFGGDRQSNCSAATPSADEIMAKAIEYSQWELGQFDSNKVTYSKYTLTETLDSKGRVKSRKEETFSVDFKSNQIQVKLLNKSQPSDSGSPGRREEKPIRLSKEIIAKYDFIYVDQQQLDGREVFLLGFAPKEGLAVNGLADRFLNKLAGWVWIDAHDYAVAQARVRLVSSVTLWAGMLGALKDFDYLVERARLTNGFWFNKSSRSTFALRRLFVSKRYKTVSRWSDVTFQETANDVPSSDQKQPNP